MEIPPNFLQTFGFQFYNSFKFKLYYHFIIRGIISKIMNKYPNSLLGGNTPYINQKIYYAIMNKLGLSLGKYTKSLSFVLCFFCFDFFILCPSMCVKTHKKNKKV